MSVAGDSESVAGVWSEGRVVEKCAPNRRSLACLWAAGVRRHCGHSEALCDTTLNETLFPSLMGLRIERERIYNITRKPNIETPLGTEEINFQRLFTSLFVLKSKMMPCE